MTGPGLLRLTRAHVAEFAGLVGEIADGDTGRLPFLAPALLFADAGAQARIGLPVPGAGDILIHDYQAIAHHAPLRTDAPIRVAATQSGKDGTTEFRIDLAQDERMCVGLSTALRLVPRQDLSAIKPTVFRDLSRIADLGSADGLHISQAQVDRYLALSGDRNPIHFDAAEARGLGLAAPIVPGLLLVSTIEPICRAALPGAALHSLRARFMAPLCNGDGFCVLLQSRGPTPGGGNKARAYLVADDKRALAIADMVFSG